MEAYIGQIEAFGFHYAPPGWLPCDGRLLPIGEYEALFSLIGTTFGGNGQTDFALPDLRGRLAMGADDAHPPGWAGGAETHALTPAELPAHGHRAGTAMAQAPAATALPLAEGAPTVPLAAAAVAAAGGGRPHGNLMPALAVNFCICTEGMYPSAD